MEKILNGFSNLTNNKKRKNSKANKNYILKDSIKTINKNFFNLSVSLSGEFAFVNTISLNRKLYNSNVEMF
jgi:hypothetical protein